MKEGQKSAEKRSTKKVDNTKRIFIILALLIILIYVVYTIYLLIEQPTDVFMVEEGKVYLEETDIGYVIRNEQVVQGENYKNGMEQIKTEGERVAKNESIFRYYSKNEEELISKIAELDEKVEEAMSQQTGLSTSDMKLLENQIDEKVELLSKLTDMSKLEELKKEISDIVTKKSNIAGDASPKGSYLKKLIDERREYENQLNSGAEYLNAPISGIISYKVDGLESVLQPTNECFSTLNKQYLENLNLKTGKIIPTSSESGKIVDNTSCYIATISKSEEAKNAKVNDKVKVRLNNNIEIPAKIVYIIRENDEETLMILQIEKQIEDLVDYRKVSFDLIWWSESGLKVPNQAIVEQDGLKYVVRNRAGYLSKLLINVKKQNEKYSIVEPYENEDLEAIGYTSKDITNYKKISVYDEILLYPDLSKVE